MMEPMVLLGCGAGSSVVSKREKENQTVEVYTNISFSCILPLCSSSVGRQQLSN